MWARLLLVGALLAVGGAAAAFAWSRSEREADAAEDATADRVAESVRSGAATAIAGLGGAAGMVPAAGPVPVEAFDAFQRDVAKVSSLDALAYVPIVTAAERPAFEAVMNKQITDLVAAGFEVAPERPVYWPVRSISPPGPVNDVILALDIAASDISARESVQARDTGDTVVTEAVAFGPDLALFFIIKPLYRPGLPVGTVEERVAAHAGFVASAYSGDALVEDISGSVEGVRFSVREGDVVLAASEPPPAADAVTRSIDVGGRTWTVDVSNGRTADHDLTWFLLTITLLLTSGLLIIVVRGAAHDRSMSRVVGLVRSTAVVGQHLASAATVQEVAAVISADVAPALGAESARLELVGASTAPEGPVAEAIRTRDVVLGRDGGERVATIPLEPDDGGVGAVVEVRWSSTEFDDPMVATLRTLAELCEQTLQRAGFTDLVAVRADRLAQLAKGLAGTTTLAQVADEITGPGRLPVGATSASLGVIDHVHGVLRVHHGETVDDDIRERFAHPPLETRLAFTDAARTGEAVLVGDMAEYERLYPASGADTAALGEGARAALPLRDGDRTIGAIVFAWSTARAFDEALVSTLSTIAEMATQSVLRAGLAEAQLADARHSRDLALLAERLAGPADTVDVIQALTDGVMTPLDATVAALGVLDHGAVVEIAATGVDHPAAEQLIAPAVGFGEPFVGPVSTMAGSFPELADAWTGAGLSSAAILPLQGRFATTIGILAIGWSAAVDDDDDLRDRLTTIAGIAGQTLDRTQLVETLRQSVARNEALADFAQVVARVSTVGELAAAVTEYAGLPVEAAVANIGLIEDNGLSVIPHPGLQPEMVGDFGARSLDDDLPGVTAIHEKVPVVLTSAGEIARQYPGRFADSATLLGLAATAHLPLIGADGNPLGAIGFAWTSEPSFSVTEMATMRTIAELASQTLERVRLGEAEHHLVSSLQHRLVSPLPERAGLELAHRYRPAAHQVGMGGDWYDGIVLDDGRYLLVIGDIAGHGITAVADMIQVRSIMTALVRSGVGLGDVFVQATRLLSTSRELVTASVAIVLIDVEAEQLSYVVAGHPPMVLTEPDGQVSVLYDGRQPLLGLPITHVEPGVVEFAPGATLTAYTDGLIERRSESIDASINRLAGVVADITPGQPLESVVDETIDAALGGEAPSDDVAVVVIRRSIS